MHDFIGTARRRWIGYVDRWQRTGKKYVDREIEIVELHVWGLRHGVKVMIEGFVEEDEYCHYVTHVIYLEGPSSPKVNKQHFTQNGIDVTRLYGPRDGDGRGGRYDAKGLAQALEGIVGRKGIRQDRTRRNTLES